MADRGPLTRRLELETFMHFAFGIWPQICDKYQTGLQKRCRTCILPESAGQLDRDGICIGCRKQKGDSSSSPEHADRTQLYNDLDTTLKEASQSADGLYDAVVLYSGGKDSLYLMSRLKEQYPHLRTLALLVDNGFMSEVAIDNAYYGARKLDIELMRYSPEPGLFRKTFRHAFLNLNAGGCYTTVDRMDGDLVFDIGRNVASRLKAPLLLAGLSAEQIEMIMGLQHFESPASVEQEPRQQSAGFSLDQLYSPVERRKYWWSGCLDGCHQPRVIYPFYAWKPAEKDIVKFVKDQELIQAGQDNPLITNNHTVPVMLAVDYATMGYSGFEPEFAIMVRSGKSHRQDWLGLFQAVEFLSKQGKFLPKCIDETISSLGLTEAKLGIKPLDLDSNLFAEYSCIKSA